MVRIYKEEGLGGLYAGLSSSLYGIAITNGVYCEYDTGNKGSGLSDQYGDPLD